LEKDSKIFFILTNTRLLCERDAEKRTSLVMSNLAQAAQELNYMHQLQILSRGDSSLMGHFPAEIGDI